MTAGGPHLVLGLGVTGRAVVGALVRHGEPVVAVDDRPNEAAAAELRDLGVDLVVARRFEFVFVPG